MNKRVELKRGKLKACPLLVRIDTHPSRTIEGEVFTRSYFADCLEEGCAAYVGGKCRRFDPIVFAEDDLK